MKKVMHGVMVSVIATLLSGIVIAAEGWLESIFRSDTYSAASDVSSVYTNGSERKTLASVMVYCARATSTWNIAIVNANSTNVIKTSTLTLASPSLVYEGYGTMPLGANAKVLVSGTIHTNMIATNTVIIQINTKQ